jgi:cation diffusion facilitator CzcD-associated flavoprotein CzcO
MIVEVAMRIAIFGAGISGLSCAFRLEQLGFTGHIDIYVRRPQIGTSFTTDEYGFTGNINGP